MIVRTQLSVSRARGATAVCAMHAANRILQRPAQPARHPGSPASLGSRSAFPASIVQASARKRRIRLPRHSRSPRTRSSATALSDAARKRPSQRAFGRSHASHSRSSRRPPGAPGGRHPRCVRKPTDRLPDPRKVVTRHAIRIMRAPGVLVSPCHASALASRIPFRRDASGHPRFPVRHRPSLPVRKPACAPVAATSFRIPLPARQRRCIRWPRAPARLSDSPTSLSPSVPPRRVPLECASVPGFKRRSRASRFQRIAARDPVSGVDPARPARRAAPNPATSPTCMPVAVPSASPTPFRHSIDCIGDDPSSTPNRHAVPRSAAAIPGSPARRRAPYRDTACHALPSHAPPATRSLSRYRASSPPPCRPARVRDHKCIYARCTCDFATRETATFRAAPATRPPRSLEVHCLCANCIAPPTRLAASPRADMGSGSRIVPWRYGVGQRR